MFPVPRLLPRNSGTKNEWYTLLLSYAKGHALNWMYQNETGPNHHKKKKESRRRPEASHLKAQFCPSLILKHL